MNTNEINESLMQQLRAEVGEPKPDEEEVKIDPKTASLLFQKFGLAEVQLTQSEKNLIKKYEQLS